ncbi:MAG: hypothetical protein JNK05_36710 [Myxococcales bacterium]|nr:hypothetical protein [Myxococcales bacterium]
MSDEPKTDDAFERVDAARLAMSNTSKALIGTALAYPAVMALAPLIFGGAGAGLGAFIWLGALLAVFAYGMTKKSFGLVAKPSDVQVSPSGVKLDGKLIDRSKLDNAAVVRDPNLDGFRVMLGKKRSIGRKLALLTKDEATARGIVAKLGLDASHATSSWTVLSGLVYSRNAAFATFAPIPLAMIMLVIAALLRSPALALSAIPVFLSMYVMLFTKTQAIVGTDGVLVKWFGLSRFCRFDDVRELAPIENGARLVKKDGSHFDVTIATPNQATNDRYGVIAAEVQALQNRIREAMSVRAASPDATVAADPFLRNDRGAAEWLAALRKVFEPGENLRAATHTEDAAWRVVLDHGASEDARVGAAAAIAVHADKKGREKLRAVAETIADTRVRVALEAAAEGDEAALVEAMNDVGAKQKR